MSKGIEPTPADVGRLVNYTGNIWSGGEREQGVITSVTEDFVFVRYGTSQTSAATKRHDLEWVNP